MSVAESRTTRGLGVALLALSLGWACRAPLPDRSLADEYLDRMLRTFPTEATAAGRHDLDNLLEDLTPEVLRAWAAYNREVVGRLTDRLAGSDMDEEDRLDAELVLRRARLVLLDLERLRRPARDPLFWTGILANATVFLLVREDLPRTTRLRAAAARARRLPRLADQAIEALSGTGPAEIVAERCQLAARQAAGSARFYRQGFAEAATDLPELRAELSEAGAEAAAALDRLTDLLQGLATTATGSPRLGPLYAERFRLATGLDTPIASILERARRDLAAKRAEVAAFGRRLWPQLFPDAAPPAGDPDLIRALFAAIGEDAAADRRAFLAEYRSLVAEVTAFVRSHDVVTLPKGLRLDIRLSPAYFLGQGVGGVYPAGPYAPDAPTILFLPAPAADASEAARGAFFRDFNHHFNVMITPHETIPGHTLQLARAARHPRQVRALLPDGVYVEGWGTFCERLLLDLGWGDELDRVAHLKKQLENIARTIIDISVHTQGMSRDEALRFVREEAFQDEHFAANLWVRAITSSPQLTFYYLGYGQVRTLYEEVRAARGDRFVLREFMDGMMELGPVPLAHYRERMLGATTAPPPSTSAAAATATIGLDAPTVG